MHLCIVFFTVIHLTTGQWIDPHSMDLGIKVKVHREKNVENKNKFNSEIPVNKPSNSDLIYLKRVVRIFLNNAYLQEDVDFMEGYINVRLSKNEHETLLNFSKSVQEYESSEISSIFENAFKKSSLNKFSESYLLIHEQIYSLVFNETSGILLGVCLSLFMTYKLVRAKFTWKFITKYFLILSYIIDFIVTYLQIKREEEINTMVNMKKLGGATPPECDPQKMSWFGFIKTQFESAFMENPCKLYYQTTYPQLIYVAPSKVFTRQFRTLILEPFGDIGEAFGKFGRSMFTSLPFGLNLILFPIMLLGVGLMFFIGFLFITKTRVKLSLLHLFTIEFGQQQNIEAPTLHITQSPIVYRRIRENREVGFQENHRDLVEEVSSNVSSQGHEESVESIGEEGTSEPASPDITGISEIGNASCSDVEN